MPGTDQQEDKAGITGLSQVPWTPQSYHYTDTYKKAEWYYNYHPSWIFLYTKLQEGYWRESLSLVKPTSQE